MPIKISNGLEVKFQPLDPGMSAEGQTQPGHFSGYAAIFNEPDENGDVIERGAFAASLSRRLDGPAVKLLWQHDPMEPIGIWEEIREDARGLYVHGRLLTDIRRGAEAASLLKAGALDGLSIGFRAVTAEKNQTTGQRHLVEIDLWEISLVTFPMAPGARIGAGVSDDSALSEAVAALSAALYDPL